MDQCDQILEGMEEMLNQFKADLGDISDEIKHLQDQSFELNIKLRNRKALESDLAAFIENLIIPPDLIEFAFSL